jgi:hypothetical protein
MEGETDEAPPQAINALDLLAMVPELGRGRAKNFWANHRLRALAAAGLQDSQEPSFGPEEMETIVAELASVKGRLGRAVARFRRTELCGSLLARRKKDLHRPPRPVGPQVLTGEAAERWMVEPASEEDTSKRSEVEEMRRFAAMRVWAQPPPACPDVL